MDMEVLIAFLIGAAASGLIAGLMVFIRSRMERGEKVKQGGGARGGIEKPKGEYRIRLCDRKKPENAWTYRLTDDEEIRIGCGDHCDLRLSDPSVSENQCKIMIGVQGLEIADTGAKYRTRQNKIRVYNGSPLKSGDILQLGNAEIEVESIQYMGQEEDGKYVPHPDTRSGLDRDQAPEEERGRNAESIDDTQAASPWNAKGTRGQAQYGEPDHPVRSPIDDTRAASPWNAKGAQNQAEYGNGYGIRGQNPSAHNPADNTQSVSSWNRRHED